MNTIIACTDFTPSSVNACRYAAFLAQKLNSKLLVFNLFEAPVVHSNAGLYGLAFTAQKTVSLKKSVSLIDKLKSEFPKTDISYFITSGSFTNELQELSLKHRITATVMGLKSKSAFSRFLSGTHGLNIVGEIKSPVIIVPESYKKFKLDKIILAIDNNEKLLKADLESFSKFCKKAAVNVKPLYVKTEDELFKPMQKAITINGESHSITTVEAENITKGILKFSGKNKFDLIAIRSKDHNPIFNLFVESTTKKIAFAAKTPVMAVHENT